MLGVAQWIGDLFSNPVDQVFFLSILGIIVVILLLLLISKIVSIRKSKKYVKEAMAKKQEEASEENKEEEHTGTKKADTDAGKESIKDGFEKGSRVY